LLRCEADFDIREARGAIDRDGGIFPPVTRMPTLAIAVNPVAHPADAGERLDIQMQQIAGVRPLVALHHRFGIETAQPIQARLRQDPRDGGAGHAGRATDRPARRATVTERDNRGRHRRRELRGRALGPRRGIQQRVNAGAAAR
jgi:hypothetical protein